MAFSSVMTKTNPDVGAGGVITTAGQGTNALTKGNLDNAKQQLANQYYASNIQSQIAYRQALTSAVPSEIALRQAQGGLMGAQAGAVPSEIQLRQAQAGLLGPEAQMKALQVMAARNALNNMGGASNTSPNAIQPNSMLTQENNNALNMPNNISSGSSPGVPGQEEEEEEGFSTPNQKTSNNTQNMGAYGLTPPQIDANTYGSKLLGFDTFTPKMQNYNAQVMDQYRQYQTKIDEASKASAAANQVNQLMQEYRNAMGQAKFKGPTLGVIPSEKSVTSSVLGGLGVDLSPEQKVDRISTQILPGAIENLKSAMGSSRFTNVDMKIAEGMNVDRSLSKNNQDFLTSWLTAVNKRMQEETQFYTKLGNPQSGAMKQHADALWSAYQKYYPVTAADGKSIDQDNLGKWPLFTSPAAIQSISQTGDYKPTELSNMVKVMKPDGTSIMLPKEGAQRLINDHPDHKMVA